MEYTLRTVENLNWITFVWVGIFVLLAISRYLYPRRFDEFLLLPISDKYFKLQGKGYEVYHPFNVILFAIQVLSFSMFLYLMAATYRPDLVNENQWLFVQITTGFGAFVLIKSISEKIIAYIMNIEVLIDGYLYEKLNYMGLISLVIFVANLVFILAIKPVKVMVFSISIAVLILYLIALISSFKRNWQSILKHFSYFILYLCALEIAPYVILYQLIV